MNNDLISRSEAEKLGATCLARRNENGQLEAIISLDYAPTVSLQDIYQEGHFDGYLEGYTKAINEERKQGKPVIKCQDCKYRVKEWREDKRMKDKGYWVYGCEHFGEIMGYWGFGGNDNEFCSDAEQKGGAE